MGSTCKEVLLHPVWDRVRTTTLSAMGAFRTQPSPRLGAPWGSHASRAPISSTPPFRLLILYKPNGVAIPDLVFMGYADPGPIPDLIFMGYRNLEPIPDLVCMGYGDPGQSLDQSRTIPDLGLCGVWRSRTDPGPGFYGVWRSWTNPGRSLCRV